MLKFYDMPVGLGKDREKSLLFYLNDMAQKTSGFVFEYCPQLVTLDNVPDDIVRVRQMLTPATITDLTEQDNLITSVVRRIHSIEYYDFEYLIIMLLLIYWKLHLLRKSLSWLP